MTYAIAAAGTGGHVFPGLAVGEALVAGGVARADVLYVGGSRLEATACPAAGFPFLQVDLRGLQRRLTSANLAIPGIVWRASRRIAAALGERRVRVVLGMGGYASVPTGLAAKRTGTVLMLHEQNAEAGLANRLMSRWARRVFGSFPVTARLPSAEWAGNPIRASLARFDRSALRDQALERYQLDPGAPVIGIFGGSLGAGALNKVAADIAGMPDDVEFSLLHLTGTSHLASVQAQAAASKRTWRPAGFEERMDLFYAAVDLVVARSGGAVAELTATSTPSILVPGGFGSSGHQHANAAALESVGAARLVDQKHIEEVVPLVSFLLGDPGQLAAMAAAAIGLARPQAAIDIAAAMVQAHG